MLRDEIDRILGTGWGLRVFSEGWLGNRGEKQDRIERAIDQAIAHPKPDPLVDPDLDDDFAGGFNLAIEQFEQNLLGELSR